MCRHLYNWNLRERIEAYENEVRSVSYYEQQNSLPELKKERPWFKGVYSLALQDVLRRLDKAYQKFFDKKGGYPKYKKKGQWNSITYPDQRKKPQFEKIKVPKVGDIKIVYHRKIPENAEIKTLSVVKDGGKWFACFSINLPDRSEPKPSPNHAVGIDLGLDSFVFASDGFCITAPKFLRNRAKDLKRLQRKLSRTPKRTAAYQKVLKALQKAYYRIRCLRNQFFYHLAHQLLSSSDCIVHEELSIPRMVRRSSSSDFGEKRRQRGLSKSIYDAGWGYFVSILQNVAQKMGKLVIGVKPHYTSQTCSECGSIVPKSLSTRTHHCKECGYKADRDLNAAINILRLGLESLGISQEAPTIMRSI
jgi:putative transposase